MCEEKNENRQDAPRARKKIGMEWLNGVKKRGGAIPGLEFLSRLDCFSRGFFLATRCLPVDVRENQRARACATIRGRPFLFFPNAPLVCTRSRGKAVDIPFDWSLKNDLVLIGPCFWAHSRQRRRKGQQKEIERRLLLASLCFGQQHHARTRHRTLTQRHRPQTRAPDFSLLCRRPDMYCPFRSNDTSARGPVPSPDRSGRRPHSSAGSQVRRSEGDAAATPSQIRRRRARTDAFLHVVVPRQHRAAPTERRQRRPRSNAFLRTGNKSACTIQATVSSLALR